MARVGHISIGGLSSGMDTDSMIKELMAVQRMKVDRLKKKNTSIGYQQDEWKKMNEKIHSFYSKEVGIFRLKSNFLRTKVSNSDERVAKVMDNEKAPIGIHQVEVVELANAARTESKRLTYNGNYVVNEKTTMEDLGLQNQFLQVVYKTPSGADETIRIEASPNETVSDFANKIKKATKDRFALDVNLDLVNKKMFISTKKMGDTQAFRLEGKIAEELGFSTDWNKGKSAKFRYNGGEVLESPSNEIIVNGLKVSAKSTGNITVDIERDNEAVYKQVVNFVKKYNELAKEMQDKLNITVSRNQRDMEPLTDEEKKALPEEEVKKWEETLRGRVFKRDRNIKGVLEDMRTTMTFAGYKDNEVYDSLASIGIGTGGFRDGTGAMLFIDGDAEVGGSRITLPNKLKEAIEKEPEEVANLLSSLGEKLYNKLTDRMKSTSGRSYMSFYDDKALREEQKRYEKRIEEMEDKLIAIEDRYRKQFAEMEKALSRANSMTAALTQQLGGLR